MYREIDSSELVIYTAFRKLKENESENTNIITVRVSMQEIIDVATAIEAIDSTVRVNLGRKSLLHLISKSQNAVKIAGDELIVFNPKSQYMRKLFYQYGPSRSTKDLLKEIK